MPQYITFRVLWKRIKAIRFMMMDKSVSRGKKLLVILGIIYLVLPVDIIPPVLFPIGFLHALVLWCAILYYLKDTLDTYWMGEKPVDYSKKYDDAIEADEYDVEVDGSGAAKAARAADEADVTGEETEEQI